MKTHLRWAVSKKVLTRIILISLFTWLASGSLLWAMPAAEDVHSFTLKNGMKVLVLEDHAIPNVTLQIFFKAGSRNEFPGITGVSHFLEHMMFNGAAKYGPKMFDRVLENAGGSSNAYTTENVTTYQDWVPRTALELIFEMEADRIGSLALDKKILESERGVVLSEYTTSLENSDEELLENQLRSVAYQAHTYRWPIIGYESDIRNWRREDIAAYYERYYAPNNAIAVVVGAISPAEVKTLAEKYLAPIASREPPRPVHTLEPEQRGEKRLIVHKDVSSPRLLIAYHVPETGAADYYALVLLNNILSLGRSSRLYRALIGDKALATEVSTYMPDALDPTLFYIYAVCVNGVSGKKLEKTVLREIDRIIAQGVTENELRKAKNNALAAFYRSLETMSDKADLIGTYEIFFGGYSKLFAAPQLYEVVTTADIRAAAAKYFRKTNRTVGIMAKDEGK
jgi:zinc protease